MKIEYISNTGFYIENNGVVFGMDLWLTQGAFEGSWFHFPQLRQTRFNIQDCSFIYISHIHPDHCDFTALANAKPQTRFIVPNYFNNLLARKLKAFGFKNVTSLAPEEELELAPELRIRLFPQFTNNLFHEAAFGSLIDSALLIKWEGRTILNCNDNYLNPEWSKRLSAEYPNLDLLLAPHSASGPYPANFRNLSLAEKKIEAERLQKQYISHWCESVRQIAPKIAVPCAAEYVVVGNLYQKNEYIGLADSEMAVSELISLQGGKSPTLPIQLDCGSILDIDTGIVEGLLIRKYSLSEKMEFAKSLDFIPFDYQWEDTFADVDFDKLFMSARQALWTKQKQMNWFLDYRVVFFIDERAEYGFNFATEDVEFISFENYCRSKPIIECYLTRQLFYQILMRRAHWNNAEGGLHIEFYRDPNIYIPEIFTLLSFLCIPMLRA